MEGCVSACGRCVYVSTRGEVCECMWEVCECICGRCVHVCRGYAAKCV